MADTTIPQQRTPTGRDNADAGWDTYAERVSRNEGRLLALEQQVAVTRSADRELIDQRSDSLARELERRADALRDLAIAERDADLREARDANRALRDLTDTAIEKNYEQSQAALTAMTQLITVWRNADREALDKQAIEYERRLGVLNHSHQANADFQTRAVTRELWQSERDAAAGREATLRDQIVALEKSMLTLAPATTVTGVRTAVVEQLMTALAASERNMETKFTTMNDKIAAMKSTLDATGGRSAGYQSLYGWIAAAVSIVLAVVVVTNTIIG